MPGSVRYIGNYNKKERIPSNREFTVQSAIQNFNEEQLGISDTCMKGGDKADNPHVVFLEHLFKKCLCLFVAFFSSIYVFCFCG